MGPLIRQLQFFDERATPGTAAWNMAMDEALLVEAIEAVLRVYRWKGPARSFGYFLPWAAAAEGAGDRELIRRWTGGGIVEHGDDFTWSLIVPAAEPLCGLRPVASYAAIHGAITRLLRRIGLDAHCAASTGAAPAGGFCFEAAAPGDILLSGRKIAGAGQRRCRHGLLHQGSIRGVDLPEDFPGTLASAIGGIVSKMPSVRIPRDLAGDLVLRRYGTESWIKKR